MTPELLPFSSHAAARRVLDRCAQLARITDEPGRITRTFLSPAMEQVTSLVSGWMHAAGLRVRLDTAGNLLGCGSPDNASARILLGSHLDTVPDAGPFDGILGTLLALELVTLWQAVPSPLAVDVVAFSEEEGVRFGVPFLGSLALTSSTPAHYLALVDRSGISLASALQGFRDTHPDADPPLLPAATRAFLEFHIEQGPVLDSRNQPLAVVSAVAGQTRGRATFTGRAGHAGTTPMELRADALAGAAEWITSVESLTRSRPGLVATVGQVSASPGAANVIPGQCLCSLDVRHASDAVRSSAVHDLLEAAQTIAARRGLRFSWASTHEQPSVPMDPQLTALAAAAIEAAGHPAPRLVSGAGHDAMILAAHVPSTMIFLRSPGGISHHPEESVALADVAAALEAGFLFLRSFAGDTGASLSSAARLSHV